MLSLSEIKAIISQTYADIALRSDIDMRLVADVFEAIRDSLYKANPSDAWDYIVTGDSKAASLVAELFSNASIENKKKRSIINADLDAITASLTWLREAFLMALIRKQIALLNELVKGNSNDLLTTWEEFYADAAVHYREDFLCMLCLQRSSWEQDKTALSRLSKLTHLLRENRWVDAFPYYEEIAGNESLDTRTRTMANVSLAEIIMYYFPDPTAAEPYIIRAEKRMPDSSPVIRAKAQLFLKKKEYSQTKNLLLNIVFSNPSDFLAFIYAGDSFLAEEALEQAEKWYIDALQKNALQTDTYRRLINLYAIKTWYTQKKELIYEQLERFINRNWFRYSDGLIAEGLATSDCFQNTELYHAYRDVAGGCYANSDMDAAIEMYEKAIRLQPNLAVAMLDLAYLYIAVNQLPQAKDYFDRALSIDNDSFDAYWGLSYYYEKTSQKEEALLSYEKCLQLRPSWRDWVHNLIGNLYYSYKEYETAAQYFRMSKDENNNINVYRENLADALTNAALEFAEKNTAADDDKAVTFYTEAAQISGNAEDWNKLGNFHFARSEWDEAITNFSKAIEINDKEPVYYGNMASVYENLSKAEQVEYWYRKATEADNENGRYANRLGIFYYNRGNYNKAIEEYTKALEHEPANEDYLNNISLAYKDSGQTELAIEALQTMLAANPANDTLWNNIGVMYFNMGNIEKAFSCYQTAMNLDNQKPLYYQNLGLAYEKNEEPAEAIQIYQEALKLQQEEAYFLNAIGLVYYRGDNYENAVSYFRKAEEKEEGNWLYHTNAGLAFSKTGKTDEAIAAYRKALLLNEGDYMNWNDLGLLLREKEDHIAAIDAYKKAIALYPNDANIYFNLAVSYFLSGNTNEANQVVLDVHLTEELRERLRAFFEENQLN